MWGTVLKRNLILKRVPRIIIKNKQTNTREIQYRLEVTGPFKAPPHQALSALTGLCLHTYKLIWPRHFWEEEEMRSSHLSSISSPGNLWTSIWDTVSVHFVRLWFSGWSGWPLSLGNTFSTEDQISTLLTIEWTHCTFCGRVSSIHQVHTPVHTSGYWLVLTSGVKKIVIQEVTHVYWFLCHQPQLYLFVL